MTKEGWYQYTLCEQMSNIAAEVEDFIRARNRFQSGEAQEDFSDFYFNKAMEHIDIITRDPKNRNRIREFEDCKKELIALRAGIFSDAYILSYWQQYTDACAFRAQRSTGDKARR